MAKTLITLEIETGPARIDRMAEWAKDMGVTVEEVRDDAARTGRLSPEYLAQQIAEMLGGDAGNDILFEGSDHYHEVLGVRVLESNGG